VTTLPWQEEAIDFRILYTDQIPIQGYCNLMKYHGVSRICKMTRFITNTVLLQSRSLAVCETPIKLVTAHTEISHADHELYYL
jgi:hypothetical protein